MRRGVWSAAVLLLSLAPLAQAGLSMEPIHGEIDHRLDATLEGQVATGPSSVLASLSQDKVPVLKGFQLQAGRAEVTIVRTSGPASVTTGPALPLGLVHDDAIQENNTEVERRLFYDLSVLPLQTSDLWNAVAFGKPGDHFQVALPHGTYSLGQTSSSPNVVRPDVPRTREIQTAIAPALKGAADALEIRTSALEATYRGDFYVLLYGASFNFASPDGSERVETGRYSSSVNFRGGLLPEKREFNAIVLLRVHSAVLSLSSGDAPLALYARDVHLNGRATFEAPTGTLAWPAGEGGTGESRSLEGDLRLATRGPAYVREDGQRFGPLTIEGFALVRVAGASMLPIVAVAAGATLGTGAALRWSPGLRRLLWAGIAGFSLVQKDGALEHRARAQLFDYVRANPGATLSVAQEHLGIGWGTVEYHVAVLERLGLVTSKRAGGKRLLFATEQGRIVDPRAWSLLRNASVRQLAATLLAPGRAATQAEVAQALDCSPQYAGRLVRKLCEVGLVSPGAETARRAFVATDLMHELARRTGILPVAGSELNVMATTHGA